MACIQQCLSALDDMVRPAFSSASIILTLSIVHGTDYIFSDFICMQACSFTFMCAFSVAYLSEIFMEPGGRGLQIF
jgi:hypothetical protein